MVQENSESISGPTEIHDATNAQNPRGIRNTLRKLLSKFAISHREKAAAKPVPDSNQIESKFPTTSIVYVTGTDYIVISSFESTR